NSLVVLTAIQGDSDHSGVVDAADFDVWYKHVGVATPFQSQGDLDTSGVVDAADFDIWVKHVGNQGLAVAAGSGGASAVPDPTAFALLGLGGALFARRRKSVYR